MKFVKQDYYEILNVAPGASNEEVKRAYRMVRKSFRPDSMAIHSLYSEEETEAISAKIDEAFRILSDAESARRYAKYHRTGSIGMSIPRDPDLFFDFVHDLDGTSPIEELANQVAAARANDVEPLHSAEPSIDLEIEDEDEDEDDTTADDADVTAPGTQLPLVLTQKAVAEAEVFIDSLEEVPETAPAPAMIRTPAGPQLGPVRARATTGDHTTRALPGSAVARSPASPADATTVSTSPVAVARQAERRNWIRETVRTRAVGPMEIEPLPREELEALEMDCGGVSGEFLQQVRRGMNVSLQDIASRTKIGIGMLRAIEADDLDRLPAKVYLKGYLTQICRMLRLPTPQIPERYLRRHGL